MIKKYKLLKELPWLDTGSIITFTDDWRQSVDHSLHKVLDSVRLNEDWLELIENENEKTFAEMELVLQNKFIAVLEIWRRYTTHGTWVGITDSIYTVMDSRKGLTVFWWKGFKSSSLLPAFSSKFEAEECIKDCREHREVLFDLDTTKE